MEVGHGLAQRKDEVSVPARKLSKHLQQKTYHDFTLTNAVMPAPDVPVTPREGYRVGVFRDRHSRRRVPMLVAAVSQERLFDLFLALLEPLGPVVDVILETSHDTRGHGHEDRCREGIDLPVLMSLCCEHEELLLHDGCAGIAVMDEAGTMEVQFDEHKLFIVYAESLEPFRRLLEQAGIERDDGLKVISEAEHLHSTHPRYMEEFDQFCCRLGIDEMVEQVSW
jgi:hypothetical protein